jgi:glycine cleavage system pyridoxal-binding protein P
MYQGRTHLKSFLRRFATTCAPFCCKTPISSGAWKRSGAVRLAHAAEPLLIVSASPFRWGCWLPRGAGCDIAVGDAQELGNL